MNKTVEQIWWDDLSKDVKDSINHSIFYQKILDVKDAYKRLGHTIH